MDWNRVFFNHYPVYFTLHYPSAKPPNVPSISRSPLDPLDFNNHLAPLFDFICFAGTGIIRFHCRKFQGSIKICCILSIDLNPIFLFFLDFIENTSVSRINYLSEITDSAPESRHKLGVFGYTPLS